MSAVTTTDKVVRVRLPQEVYERAKAEASTQRRGLPEVLASLVEEGLESRLSIHELFVYVPLQVFVELHHNLPNEVVRDVLRAIRRARWSAFGFSPGPAELHAEWQARGASPEDAAVTAQLLEEGVATLISGNRDFLRGYPTSPFLSCRRKRQYVN